MPSTTTTTTSTPTSPTTLLPTNAKVALPKKESYTTAPSVHSTSSRSEVEVPTSTGKAVRRVSIDKVRAKWEQATFGKSAKSVSFDEHVKNLSSSVPEVRRASAEQLQYQPPEALRSISKLLLTITSNDSDTWTAAYAYRAYLRQLKEKELKIHPDKGSTV